MGLKLLIISLWTPQYILKKEIDRVAEVTNCCLDHLLSIYASEKLEVIREKELIMKGGLEERRNIMANSHNMRVEALVEILGVEEAVSLGRGALFKAGLKLGQEAKVRLGVGNSLHDLINAARVLYRVLGIDFEIKESSGKIDMIVHKCSLSNYYNSKTCRILSAADEGVVQGLNENIHLNFIERMTEGPSKCVARIILSEKS